LTIKPLKVKVTYPSNLGSADLKTIVQATNKKHYAIKEVSDGNGFVPVTEIFCYELAKELDIPTPNYQIIEMPNGTLAFGSEWEGGIFPSNFISDILLNKIKVNDFNIFVSELYAFDIFVNNVDRHFGNYIFRNTYNYETLSLAFDFSRAWYAYNSSNPFNYDCIDTDCNTLSCNNVLKQFNQFDSNITKNTLDKIYNIDVKMIENILTKIPDLWFDSSKRLDLIYFWKNDMISRINYLKGRI
jgi:hypothetical protein